MFKPSGFHRLVKCAGSYKASRNRPESTSPEAEEGTGVHEVAAKVLESYQGDGSVLTCESFVGTTTSNGIYITDDLAAVADVYVKHILSIVQERGLLRSMSVEKYVKIVRLHPECGGTPDVVIWCEKTFTLWIIDLKTGRKTVEHVECLQLIAYAIGCIDEVRNSRPHIEQQITVNMTIVQPRGYHFDGTIRTWTVNATDLRPFGNMLRSAIEEAEKDNPMCHAGPWCGYCEAAAVCNTLQQAGAAVLDRIQVMQVDNLSPENRSFELDYLDRGLELVKARYDALLAEAESLDGQGVQTPGWGVGEGRASTVWLHSPEDVANMGDLFGVDLRKPLTVVTPTQAIKDKKVDATVIKAYSKKIPGKKKFVRVKETITAKMFSRGK